MYEYLADLGLIGAGAGAGIGRDSAGAGVTLNTWGSVVRETQTRSFVGGTGAGYAAGVANDYYDDHDWSMMNDEYV